jgi:hypothetical protein
MNDISKLSIVNRKRAIIESNKPSPDGSGNPFAPSFGVKD